MGAISNDRSIYVTGKFDGLSKEEVWARLLATGAQGTNSKAARAYLAADPADPKLGVTGKPIHTLADLPPSLDGWLGRMAAAVEHRTGELREYGHVSAVTHFAHGPAVDDARIARIGAAVGGLPADVVSLMRQFDGLSCVLATVTSPLSIPDLLLPAYGLADPAHPLWDGRVDWLVAAAVFPPWEQVLLTPPDQRPCNHTGYGAKDTLKLGKVKVKAGDLFPRLFAFDWFHPFAGAALWLDPMADEAQVVYGFDHWADLTSAHPVPLRQYLEALAAGVWGRMSFAAPHPIRPVSKTAWPSYVRDVHGAPWVFVELK